jgi:hypothetical protein
MNAGIGPGEIPLPIQRLAAIADNHQIAGLGLLERQPGALEPGAWPVLSFINQYGVVAAAQARVALQSGKQALTEGTVLFALAEIDAAADGPAMETVTWRWIATPLQWQSGTQLQLVDLGGLLQSCPRCPCVSNVVRYAEWREENESGGFLFEQGGR